MKRNRLPLYLVALVALGSGLVNLLSVINTALPERMAVLDKFFTLEFIHLSRFLTLLTGFALIISSINLLKRKKRAFQFGLALALSSVVFHMIKGLDYEEASVSLFLFFLLLFSRRRFTVKSTLPDVRSAVLRFASALLIVFCYSIAGFWLLDRRHFNTNFRLNDAVRETLQFLSLSGNPNLHPRTRYARWFLDSLYLISLTGIAYSIVALFRPVRYQFRVLPFEREKARMILERYGRHSLDYFKLWHDKSYFFSDSQKTFLAYRVGSNFAVVLADPVGPEEEIEAIVRDFITLCTDNDWGVAFHQTLPDFLPIYEKLGLKKLKIGDDAIVELTRFTLAGKEGKTFRHTLHRLEEEGIHSEYFEPPISTATLQQAKTISDEWLQIAGRRERGFTLGVFDPDYVRSTPVFAATDKNGTVLGFANLIPSYKKGEATIDLMRRRTDAPNGIMDFLFLKLFQDLAQKGFERFSLGMAPMSGFNESEEPTAEERAIHAFVQRMNFLFSFKGLRAYKAKFATLWEPRYVIYQNTFDLPRHAIAINTISKL